MRVIITGATGMVGEGVLFECLENAAVLEVLIIGRRSYGMVHAKLKELIVKDFSEINEYSDVLSRYDGCFFCAGVSSVGENEESFTKKTFDFVVPFAISLAEINPALTFIYVSGNRTDSTEKGGVMWARVKGRTENALMKLPFKGQYNFRPAIIKGFKGHKKREDVIQDHGPVNRAFYFCQNAEAFRAGEGDD